MTKHAKLSASGSATWLNCPASIKATENIQSTSSIFAEEGTFAHAIAELCLNTNTNSSYYLSNPIPDKIYKEVSADFIYDKEMADYIQTYLDYVRSFNLPIQVEVRCDYSKYVPEGFGTSDAIILDNPNSTLHVIDLKYGQGVKVFAQDNTQAKLYALGAYINLPEAIQKQLTTITTHIVQPRMDHIDEASITTVELMEFAEYAKQQATNALSANPTFNPGEKQCKWCRAKATCSALAKMTEETLLAKFEDLTDESGSLSPPTEQLTHNQLALILTKKQLIESFLSAIETHVIGLLNSGIDFPGFKLVEGRSLSKWTLNAEEALSQYIPHDKLYKQSLITITEAKKLVDKDIISEYTVKPAGKPVLALMSDKRPAINTLKF